MIEAPIPTSEHDQTPKQHTVSEAYRKVHKNYVLASGLLASWFLIGVTIETKERWGITLQSPRGVPLILFSLVLYFGYRLVIEWVQCRASRENKAARLDYRVSHLIALTALAIPAIQFVFRRQIVDIIVKTTERYAWLGRTAVALIGILLVYVVSFTYKDEQDTILHKVRPILQRIPVIGGFLSDWLSLVKLRLALLALMALILQFMASKIYETLITLLNRSGH